MTPIIETNALTKRYGTHHGISDIDLTVQQGEVFGFLGPNGSGKTTMIRTLLDFLHPTSGQARIFGMDSHKDSIAIRALVGNLPTEFTLEDRLSGSDLLGLFARLRGVTDLSYAHELAERLDADFSRPMRRLSRGNKQKIGVIAALFHRPPLLILDEPTNGLDPLMQEQFHTIVQETKAAGSTIFLSSHILPEVERMCDRVAMIRDGRLVAVETISDLLTRRMRRLTLTFTEPVDPGAFSTLPGVSDVCADGVTLRLTLSNATQIDAVVKVAATRTLVDLDVEHPSLEEHFLRFYESADANPTAEPARGERT